MNQTFKFILFLVAVVCFCGLNLLLPAQDHDNTKTVFYQSFDISRDGKKICFSAIINENGNGDKNKWDIYSMNIDGSNLVKLTNNYAADVAPSWSPDGSKIVFGSERDDDSKELYIMNADGKYPVRLTDNKFKELGAAWSPDGKKIAFISDRDGNYELYTMSVDGANVKRLTKTEDKEYSPCWSSDGKSIVYYYEKKNGKGQIYVADAGGKGTYRITKDTLNDFFPSWTPDGSILYCSNLKDKRTMLSLKVDDQCIKRENCAITKKAQKVNIDAFVARYTPDGKKIVYINGKWPESQIYIANADGSNIKLLSNSVALMKIEN